MIFGKMLDFYSLKEPLISIYLSIAKNSIILYLGVKSNEIQRNANGGGSYLGYLLTLRNEGIGIKQD